MMRTSTASTTPTDSIGVVDAAIMDAAIMDAAITTNSANTPVDASVASVASPVQRRYMDVYESDRLDDAASRMRGKACGREIREKAMQKLTASGPFSKPCSQAQVAKDLGIDRKTVSKWLQNAKQMQDLDESGAMHTPAPRPSGGARVECMKLARSHKVLLAQMAISTRMTLEQIRDYLMHNVDGTFPFVSKTTLSKSLHSIGVERLTQKKVDPMRSLGSARREEAVDYRKAQISSSTPTSASRVAAEDPSLNADNFLFMDETNVPLNITRPRQQAWTDGSGKNAYLEVTKGKEDYLGLIACMGLLFLPGAKDAGGNRYTQETIGSRTIGREEDDAREQVRQSLARTLPPPGNTSDSEAFIKSGTFGMVHMDVPCPDNIPMHSQMQSKINARLFLAWHITPPSRRDDSIPWRFGEEQDGKEPVLGTAGKGGEGKRTKPNPAHKTTLWSMDHIKNAVRILQTSSGDSDEYIQSAERDVMNFLYLNGVEDRVVEEDGTLHASRRASSSELARRAASVLDKKWSGLPRRYFTSRSYKGGSLHSPLGTMHDFRRFVQQCSELVHLHYGREVRDDVRFGADNASTHGNVHVNTDQASFMHEWVTSYLGVRGFVFIPVRQPKFDPVESLFRFIKGQLWNEQLPPTGRFRAPDLARLIDDAFRKVTAPMVASWFSASCYAFQSVHAPLPCIRAVRLMGRGGGSSGSDGSDSGGDDATCGVREAYLNERNGEASTRLPLMAHCYRGGEGDASSADAKAVLDSITEAIQKVGEAAAGLTLSRIKQSTMAPDERDAEINRMVVEWKVRFSGYLDSLTRIHLLADLTPKANVTSSSPSPDRSRRQDEAMHVLMGIVYDVQTRLKYAKRRVLNEPKEDSLSSVCAVMGNEHASATLSPLSAFCHPPTPSASSTSADFTSGAAQGDVVCMDSHGRVRGTHGADETHWTYHRSASHVPASVFLDETGAFSRAISSMAERITKGSDLSEAACIPADASRAEKNILSRFLSVARRIAPRLMTRSGASIDAPVIGSDRSVDKVDRVRDGVVVLRLDNGRTVSARVQAVPSGATDVSTSPDDPHHEWASWGGVSFRNRLPARDRVLRGLRRRFLDTKFASSDVDVTSAADCIDVFAQRIPPLILPEQAKKREAQLGKEDAVEGRRWPGFPIVSWSYGLMQARDYASGVSDEHANAFANILPRNSAKPPLVFAAYTADDWAGDDAAEAKVLANMSRSLGEDISASKLARLPVHKEELARWNRALKKLGAPDVDEEGIALFPALLIMTAAEHAAMADKRDVTQSPVNGKSSKHYSGVRDAVGGGNMEFEPDDDANTWCIFSVYYLTPPSSRAASKPPTAKLLTGAADGIRSIARIDAQRIHFQIAGAQLERKMRSGMPVSTTPVVKMKENIHVKLKEYAQLYIPSNPVLDTHAHKAAAEVAALMISQVVEDGSDGPRETISELRRLQSSSLPSPSSPGQASGLFRKLTDPMFKAVQGPKLNVHPRDREGLDQGYVFARTEDGEWAVFSRDNDLFDVPQYRRMLRLAERVGDDERVRQSTTKEALEKRYIPPSEGKVVSASGLMRGFLFVSKEEKPLSATRPADHVFPLTSSSSFTPLTPLRNKEEAVYLFKRAEREPVCQRGWTIAASGSGRMELQPPPGSVHSKRQLRLVTENANYGMVEDVPSSSLNVPLPVTMYAQKVRIGGSVYHNRNLVSERVTPVKTALVSWPDHVPNRVRRLCTQRLVVGYEDWHASLGHALRRAMYYNFDDRFSDVDTSMGWEGLNALLGVANGARSSASVLASPSAVSLLVRDMLICPRGGVSGSAYVVRMSTSGDRSELPYAPLFVADREDLKLHWAFDISESGATGRVLPVKRVYQ